MLLSRRLFPVLALVAGVTISCKDKPAETAPDAAMAKEATSVAPLASAPADAAAASASASAAASGSAGHDEGRRGHFGPASMFFQAARDLGELKDETKAKIAAAEKSGHGSGAGASMEAMKDATKGIHTELIAGLKANKIDNAKLEPHYAAIEKIGATAHEKEGEALTALHAALDATQRKAVATTVRAKQAEREAHMAKRSHEGDGGADGGKGGHNTNAGKRSLERLTRGLELDAEQQKKLDAIAAKDDGKGGRGPDMAEMKKKIEALAAAFEKDAFDAKKADPFDAKKARGPIEQEGKLLAQLLPILKPEQREKLATRMEKGPSPHGRRGGPGGHRQHGGGGGGGDDDDDD